MNVLKPQVSTNLAIPSVLFVHFIHLFSESLLIYFIKNIVYMGLNAPAF